MYIEASVRLVISTFSNGTSIVSMESSDVMIPIMYRDKYSRDRDDVFTAKGNVPGVVIGQKLKLSGDFVSTAKYGWQFVFKDYEELLPSDEASIATYLCSSMFPGIGPVIAWAIVEKFKGESLNILENNPERLREVTGIGETRLQSLITEFEEKKVVKELALMLAPHGIKMSKIMKVYEKHGKQAVSEIKANPYQLIEDISGIGFHTADQIAMAIGVPFDSQNRIKAAILYLLQASAQMSGHLFLYKKNMMDTVQKNLGTHYSGVPKGLIEQAIESLGLEQNIVIVDEDKIYLKMFYLEECTAISHIKDRIYGKYESYKVPVAALIPEMERKFKIIYAEKQKEALIASERNGISVITGGPGTGKSTILRGIIEAYRMHNPDPGAIALCAPTGRAAKRMKEATGIPASTIHRMLGIQKNHSGHLVSCYHAENPIRAKLVVVDETSMLDIQVFNCLMDAIDPEARIIFVGDADQLPPVGPGNVFKDIVACGKIPTVMLDKIFRQKHTSSIVLNAYKMNHGEEDFLFDENFEFIEAESDELAAEAIVKQYMIEVEKYGSENVQVLSPLRKNTKCGVNALNKDIQSLVTPEYQGIQSAYANMHQIRVGDKVMQMKNNYDLNVFNGDVGIVEGIKKIDAQNKVVTVMYEEPINYDQDSLSDVDLSYCTTVHKSQGSEYQVVILPAIIAHSIFLTRNIFYTAMTRAKQRLIIIGDPAALQTAAKNNKTSARNTNMINRI